MSLLTHVDYRIVHCSATPPSLDIGAADIRRWHLERGFADIGYHFVIRRDGSLEAGRPLHVVGAHARPWNQRSVGICLVGGVNASRKPANNFTKEQFSSLRELIRKLTVKYPGVAIIGHRDVPGVKKACPSFDVKFWLKKEGMDHGSTN